MTDGTIDREIIQESIRVEILATFHRIQLFVIFGITLSCIFLPLINREDADVMLMKPEDIKSTVENQETDMERLAQMMYEVAGNISPSSDNKYNKQRKVKPNGSERFVIVFEAVVDGLLAGKENQKWTAKEVDLIKVLTNKHKTKAEGGNKEKCFTVLSLAFKHKLVKIIKKLFELLTFEIKPEDTADAKKLGVIVNGITPMTLRDLKPNEGETGKNESQSILPCLEYLGHGNEDGAEILDIGPVRLVENVYNRMTTTVYVVMIVLHTLYMSLFSYSSMYLMDKFRNQTELDRFDRHAIVFYIVLPIEPLTFFTCYAIQLCLGYNAFQKSDDLNLRYIIWKCSPWAVRLLFSCLVIVSIIAFCMYEMIMVHNILSITLLVGWLTTLSFTEGVKPLRVFWRMILQMISVDVYKILLVYAFVLISFSFALHIQFQLSQAIIDEYPTPLHTMFLVYQLMFGNGELFNDDFKHNMKAGGGGEGVSIFLFVAYTVIATLVLINLLIAMMNTSYEEVMKELRLSRRIASLKRALMLEKSILKICGCGGLVIFWKTVFKKGTFNESTIQEERESPTFWYVEVAKSKYVSYKDNGSADSQAKPSEDDAVKLIQELKDEMINMNRKLDIFRDKVTGTSTRVDDEHIEL